MFSKMVNRYYYGKSGKGDYTKEDLPQNRWQLFWEMLRVRATGLIRLNMMYAVAWLPAIIVIGRGVLLWYTGLVSIAGMQAEVEAGTMAAADLAQNMALFDNSITAIIMQTLLLLVPCIAITGPFTAGVSLITRNWARDEHAFIWSDFKDAVKDNWKQGLLTSAITGFMPLVLYVCFTFYGDMAAQNAFFMVPQVLSISLVLLWLCTLMYTYPQMVTYRLRYRDLLKNSFFMSIARLPMTVGLKLLSVVPVAIAAAVGLLTPYFQYALLALGVYYILFGFALSRFVGASYTNAVFDRMINTRVEGAQVNKGLYVADDDDDEDEADAETEASTADSHEA